MSLLQTLRQDMTQTAAEVQTGYKKAPEGTYPMILDSVGEDEYNGEAYVTVKAVHAEGDYEGSVEFINLYVMSENSDKARIAQENLIKLAIAAEVNPDTMEFEDLQGKEVNIKKTAWKTDSSKFNYHIAFEDKDWDNFRAYQEQAKAQVNGTAPAAAPVKEEPKADASKPNFLQAK